MARVYLIVAAFILTSCLGVEYEKVTDYSTRSTVYGWVDVGDIRGNRMISIIMRQNRPETKYRYPHMAFRKFAGGYVFAHNALPNGSFQLHTMQLQSCLGILCNNTINEYNFGSQASGFGAVSVNKPSVYFLGNFELNKGKFKLFSPGTFDFKRASRGPSRKQLLGFIIKEMPSAQPVVNQRLRAAYNRL